MPLPAPPSGLPPRPPAGPGAPRPGNPVLSEAGAPARAVPPQRPPLTEAELQEQKRRRDLRNINITLYSGSLLLVAAAALFIGISIPEQARFAGVAVLAALFYASGLAIHSRKQALRPAAVAFTGTGLALIPVVGLAFYNLILAEPVLAWLLTSVVGTAAFAYAAARLNSRVVSYLALTFLLSTALASGAALRSGIVWYFICTVLLATLISLAAIRKPGWLRNVYLEAFVTSHRFLVPATAAAAVLTAPDLGSGPLSLLFLAFAAYYGVLLWTAPRSQALLHSYGLRSAATAGFAILAFRLTDSWPATLLAAAVLLGVQAALLFTGRPRYLLFAAGADLPGAARPSRRAGMDERASNGRKRAERTYLTDVLVILALQYMTGTAAAVVYALDSQGGSGESVLFAVSAAAVQVTLCASAWRLSQRAELLAGAGVLLPAAASLSTPASQLWPVLLNLGILTGYFVLRAVRSRARVRSGFVLAARASAAVALPLTVFLVLRTQDAGTAGSWTVTAAFLAAAGSQLWSVLAAASGRNELFPRTVPAVSAGAAVLLAALLRFEDLPSTAPAVGALWIIVLLNAAYSLLPMRSNRELAAAYAPVGFVTAAVLGAGLFGVRGYGLLTAAALAYSLLQSLKPVVPAQRAWHFTAAQVLMAVLAALAAADLGLGTDGVFVVVAAVLAAQHAARTLLGRRLEKFGPVHALRWGTLLALAAVPPSYYMLLPSEARAETAAVLLLTAAGSAVLAQLAAALRPLRAGGFAGAPAAAAGLVLLLAVGVRAAEFPAAAQTLWVLWLAFTANLLTAVLHRRTRLAFMAPAGFAAATLLGAGVLGIRGYELILAAALAYCMALLRDRSTGLRGIYLAGSQGAGTVLAALLAADAAGNSASAFAAALGLGLAAGQILRTVLHDRVKALGAAETLRWGGLAALALVPASCLLLDDLVDPAAVLTAVLSAAAAFAVSQLDAARRNGRGVPLPHAAALILAAAAGAALAVPAVRGIDGPYALWALAVLWIGLGANLVCSLLLGPGRWELLAAAGFTVAAVSGAGLLGLRGYELLVLAALACGLFLARHRRAHRGQYLLAAQLLAGILALLVARDAGADIHGLAAAGTAALAAAQLLRTVLEPRPAAPWARAALWTSVGILALTPAAYAALAEAPHRDVVTLQLLLLLAVSAAEFARSRHTPSLFPGLYAVGALPLVLSDAVGLASGAVLTGAVMPAAAAGLVLATLSAGALAGHIRVHSHARPATVLLAASAAYALAVLPAAAAADGNLLLAALTPALLGAAVLAGSYTRSIPWLAAGTPVLLLAAALLAAAGFEQELLNRPFPPGYGLLWPVWGTALALQAIRLFLCLGESVSTLRVRIMGAASSAVLLLGAVPAMAEYNASSVAGALTLVAALGLAVREVPGPLRETAAEAACLPAALAVQRIAWFTAGSVDAFWSVQYWVVVLAGIAAWEYLRNRPRRGTALLSGAAVILSASGLGTVVSGGTGEQLWALVAHTGLLAFGLLASRKLFTMWGAAGVALAVLWYLRGYTFLLLALLAAGLIALAIWRLTRVRTAPEQPVEEVLEER
ncbi:hypothetical protein ITX31_07170 [Arthrobacter gandavensis]|uniref:hypothetical protein n=1 Tax=Arthrobacter gandavensis TaxID=169960 RepID=UPI00188E740F|nr:hypothetical protein [Arthrobacter gandavensis]MBF4993892.1 hypothetical protein [Arthrobacter gandavensis]